MQKVNHSLRWYVDKIKKGERFSFSRYCSGEWMRIIDGIRKPFGLQYSNIRPDWLERAEGVKKWTKEEIFYAPPDYCDAVTKTITEAHGGNSFLALQDIDYLKRCKTLDNRSTRYDKIQKWLKENNINITWHNQSVMMAAGYKGELGPLTKELYHLNTVVVGPPYLRPLPFYQHFIELPDPEKQHCWTVVDEIEGQLRQCKDAFICLSASSMSNVLIHRLYPVIGKHCWMIDFGAIWDVHVGEITRPKHRDMTPEIIKANLGGRTCQG